MPPNDPVFHLAAERMLDGITCGDDASSRRNRGRYGLDFGAFVWRGSGLYTQLVALHAPVLGLGVAVRALDSGRWRPLAALLLAATALSHIGFGYVACVSAALSAVTEHGLRLRQRVTRRVRGRGDDTHRANVDDHATALRASIAERSARDAVAAGDTLSAREHQRWRLAAQWMPITGGASRPPIQKPMPSEIGRYARP